MNKKSTWLKLSAILLGAGTLLNGGGCLNLEDFWQGIWGRGWPTDSLWLNITWDALHEELFG